MKPPHALVDGLPQPWPSAVWGVVGWLAAHQSPDGRWAAETFDRWCDGLSIDRTKPLPGAGETRHDVAVTSLALCANLGAGWTNRDRHPVAATVGRGLRWLKSQQAENGRIRQPGVDESLEAHALATLALTEAYGMTRSRLYREPSRRALLHLLETQGKDGAWLRADGSGEVDVLGTFWALFPLKSLQGIERDAERRGRKALGLATEQQAFARFRPWLNAHTDPATGIVTAPPSSNARPGENPLVLTAAGLLARIFLGDDPRKDALVKKAAAYLAKHPPTAEDGDPASDGLYHYFGTIGLFQVGGPAWKIWYGKLKTKVVDTRHDEGSICDLLNSWDPRGAWTRPRGRVAATALAELCLQVYYRYRKWEGSKSRVSRRAPHRVLVGTWKRSTLPSHAVKFEDHLGRALPIEAAHLSAEIHGVRARVVMDLWVRNPLKGQTEGGLRLRLPDGAAPYYLAFGETQVTQAIPFAPTADVMTSVPTLHARATGAWGTVREARMAPTDRSRRTLRELVRGGNDPALLTWAGAGVFDLGIFPLLPHKLHRVVLGYEVDLTSLGDHYELCLDLPEDVPDVAAALAVRGARARTLPEAPVLDGVRRWVNPAQRAIRVLVDAPGDVVLQGTDAAGREYVAAWIEPDVAALSSGVAAPRAIFLLDASASIEAEHFSTRLRLLEALLAANRPALGEFAVGVFDTRVRWWRDGFTENTPENVEALMAFADSLELGGATDLTRALAEASALEGECDVFLLSDGVATWGGMELSDLARAHGKDRRIFAYRTGLEGEAAPLMATLTEATGGALVSVLGENDVPAAAIAHRYGVWRITDLAIPGVTDLFAVGRPLTIHHGQQLRLVGRGRPEEGAVLTLGLQRGPEDKTLRVTLPEAIPSGMAARAYGAAAVTELEALGEPVWEEAYAYASHFRVVRGSASLLMLETEKDYERFGFDEVDHAPQVEGTPVRPLLPTLEPARLPDPREGLLAIMDAVRDVRDGRFVLPSDLFDDLARVPTERLALPRVTLDDEKETPSLREIGGRLDLHPESLEALLGAAFAAWEAGQPERAYRALHCGLPKHAGSRLLLWQLARMAEELHLGEQALVWYEAALGLARSHGDLIEIVVRDYNRFLRHVLEGRRAPSLQAFARARARSLEQLGLDAEADLVVMLVASAPREDLELCLIDEQGRRSYRKYHDLSDGAFYAGRTERGRGPKMFVAPQARPGSYTIEVVYANRCAASENWPIRAQVIIVRDWGRPSERMTIRTVVVRDPGEAFPVALPPR